MATNGAVLVEDRASITFGVELYIPWDAPEAVVDISLEGVVPLRHTPDVIGLVGRREGAAESRVLQGRDIRNVRVLIPDSRGVDHPGVCLAQFSLNNVHKRGLKHHNFISSFRGVDQNFHDVTIVDMGDVPESSISIPELSMMSQLATWGGTSRNLRGCVRRLSSVSVRVGRVVVYSGEYGSSVICICTWRDFIWTWPSCGGAQCRGAPCGRARPRTAWTS